VAAARLADVGTGDPHPPVLGRRCQHPLKQLAIALLQLVALAQGDPGLGDSSRQGVADALQLAETGDPRQAGRSRDPGVDIEPREGLGGKAGQLALEAPDLTPQLDPSEPLVAADSKLV